MNDLNALLDRAAGPAAPVGLDPSADLSRGRRALIRVRRRRGATGLLGIAAAGVLGVGVVRSAADDPSGPQQAIEREQEPGDPTKAAAVALLSQPFEAGPYTFEATPEGWEVQGSRPTSVTIAPVGFPDQHPDSFLGKLVILFDGNPVSGERVEHDGRTFWVRGDSGHTTIVTHTLPGEPEGNVRVQFPDDAGWDRETMLDFLAGVHVGPGARQAAG